MTHDRHSSQAPPATVHLGPLVMVASPGETRREVPDAPGLSEWEVFPRTTWA